VFTANNINVPNNPIMLHALNGPVNRKTFIFPGQIWWLHWIFSGWWWTFCYTFYSGYKYFQINHDDS